jgi:hypothetical protein
MMSGARRHIAGRGADAPNGGCRFPHNLCPTALASAVIERAKSFLQLMQQRSPGIRTKGQLANTKHRVAHRHQRALPKVLIARPLVPFAWPPSAVDIFAPPLPMTTASLEAMPIPFLEENGGPPHHHIQSTVRRRYSDAANPGYAAHRPASARAGGGAGTWHVGDDAARPGADRITDSPGAAPTGPSAGALTR